MVDNFLCATSGQKCDFRNLVACNQSHGWHLKQLMPQIFPWDMSIKWREISAACKKKCLCSRAQLFVYQKSNFLFSKWCRFQIVQVGPELQWLLPCDATLNKLVLLNFEPKIVEEWIITCRSSFATLAPHSEPAITQTQRKVLSRSYAISNTWKSTRYHFSTDISKRKWKIDQFLKGETCQYSTLHSEKTSLLQWFQSRRRRLEILLRSRKRSPPNWPHIAHTHTTCRTTWWLP